jgi:hypothetical protein
MSDKLNMKERQILEKATQKYQKLLQQQGGSNLTDFVKKVTSSRVLELYLKYLGLTTLNSATLVPFALLLGKQYFEQYITKKVQRGGADLIPREIPFVDNPAIGTFLVLAGIPLVGLNAHTLVPLGVLMIVYEMVSQLYSRSSSSSSSSRPSSRRSSRPSSRRSSRSSSRSRGRSSGRRMRGGDGSQYATTLSAVDANAPWQRTYEQCLPFARQSECSAAANVARNIQETINPGVTNAMRGGKRSKKHSNKHSKKHSSKRSSKRHSSKKHSSKRKHRR